MAYKTVEKKELQLTPKITLELSWIKTPYGFKHEAVAKMDTNEILGKTKCVYYNRTWEKYEYQTVILQAIDLFAPEDQKEALRKYYKEVNHLPGETDFLQTVSAASAMFGVICGDDKETATKYQKKFLEKVPGINFPEGFDDLPLEEREKRLSGAINAGLER